MTDPSSATPQDHIKTLEAVAPGPAPAGVSFHQVTAAILWALPLLRAMHESPSSGKSWTPQDHYRTLAHLAGECATPASTPAEALAWIMPYVRALAFPSNPRVTAHLHTLEDIADSAVKIMVNEPHRTKEMADWALPILRAYVIRYVQNPPTKNTPESNIHNLRLLATGESVAWDLVETALGWALPILEATEAPLRRHNLTVSLDTWADTIEMTHLPLSPEKRMNMAKCMRDGASAIRVSAPTFAQTSRTPESHVHNLKMFASGQAVPGDLMLAAARWAAPVLEASTGGDRSDAATWLELTAAASTMPSNPPITEDWKIRFRSIAAMLRATVQPPAVSIAPPGEKKRLAADLESIAISLENVSDKTPPPLLTIKMAMRGAAAMLRACSSCPTIFDTAEREDMARRLEKQAEEETPPDQELLRMAQIIRTAPVKKTPVGTATDPSDMATWLMEMSRWPVGTMVTMTDHWSNQFCKAAAMIHAPAPNNSRYSEEDRRKVVEFLRTVSNDQRMPASMAEMYARAMAMIDTMASRSSKTMIEYADELRTAAADPSLGGLKLRSLIRNAAMVIQGNGIAIEEQDKLAAFIEKKFPGELDGMPPVTVAIRMMSEPMCGSADELEAHRILGGKPGESILDVAKRLVDSNLIPAGATCSHCKVVFKNTTNGICLIATNYTCKTCYDLGKRPYTPAYYRLPTLDAAQIPVTRDLALDVLRSFLATIQRAFPYAPSPSPEQWATAREALIVVLGRDMMSAIMGEHTADSESARDKIDLDHARRTLCEVREALGAIPLEESTQNAAMRATKARDLAHVDLRKIQSILGCKVDELPVATAERISSELKAAQEELSAIRAMMPQQEQESLVETVAMFSRYLTAVMAALGYWNPLPKIAELQSAIEAKWIKRCRPGTMNMIASVCHCGALPGSMHSTIPEAPSPGERTLREQYLDQRDAAWKELRKIRDLIGVESCEEIEGEIRVLQRDIVDLASEQEEKNKAEWCSPERFVKGPHQCRTCCALPGNAHNPESVITTATGIIRETMNLARRGKQLHREKLPELKCALEVALLAMGIQSAPSRVEEVICQREAAWKELREIREAIGANPEESTLDEVNHLMADRRTKDTAIRTLQMIHAAVGGLESEATLDAVTHAMSAKAQQWESLTQARDEIKVIRGALRAGQAETVLDAVSRSVQEKKNAEADAIVMKRQRDSSADTLEKLMAALGLSHPLPEEQEIRAMSQRCGHENCWSSRPVLCPAHETEAQQKTWLDSEITNKPAEAAAIATLQNAVREARNGSRPRREALLPLANAIDWMLTQVFRSSQGLRPFEESPAPEVDDQEAPMSESESYGWAHQAIRPMARANVEIHVREQVLDLVASAVREAWARRRFSVIKMGRQ
jgi:hypothetical protein